MEIPFPIEFLVAGTPVSLQAKRRQSLDQWKSLVIAASREVLPDAHFATDVPLSVTLFYFPPGEMAGDVDNIIKPILDALGRHIYVDDRQIHRVVAQKFEPDDIFPFRAPSPTLEAALLAQKPILYVRLSDNPFEDLN
ncbi:RusA family crossover junction endodeoxyribonuclease [Rhodopseudomonas palustris]|uniref:RusA family crossover junction endodeoxyribonuclease n=1 Tax=Rhodopseudomonas palustris TaxID=1076 RepID=UPI000E5A6111|nr:RusA family crossover junction endodeoxyribonuclease [Rhodopseudomonas palustris]QLH73442.1 RusA family crossover junction endodeoxyribonuclease [Rhodopseudomonas palustris]RIA02848.1 RusA family crossover junction endodeoxyribonuclease [Rhodopseudomonas palustris]